MTAPPTRVWTDRASQIRRLREPGETLAKIGHRFGLSAERVRQILLDEAPRGLVCSGSEVACNDPEEPVREDSRLMGSVELPGELAGREAE